MGGGRGGPFKSSWALSVLRSRRRWGPSRRRGGESGPCAGQGQFLWILSGSLATPPAPPAGFTLLRCLFTDEAEEGQAAPGVVEASGQLSKPGLSSESAGQALAGQGCSLRAARLPGGFLKSPRTSLLPLPIPKRMRSRSRGPVSECELACLEALDARTRLQPEVRWHRASQPPAWQLAAPAPSHREERNQGRRGGPERPL